MDGEFRGDEVHVGGDARQRFHDSRGYGYPLDGNHIALARVEAAHLLLRGDLDTVDGMGFREFLADQPPGFGARFLVYADIRDRGFYLSPDRDPWSPDPGAGDLVVYPRGKGPQDGDVQYRMRVVGERTSLSAADLVETPTVLAIVDEESDITYFDVERVDPVGDSSYTPDTTANAVLLDDRVFVWDPPEALHQEGFYGQPLGGRASDHDAIQLSLLEGAYLAATGSLDFGTAGGGTGEAEDGGGDDDELDGAEHATDATGGTDDSVAGSGTGPTESMQDVLERGRAVEGGRFDRRLRVYRALRNRGMVPKTGYKFGADFRVYDDVDSIDDLGHSTILVRALPLDHEFDPRDVALDVRLAHGVRKQMVFALDAPDADTIDWLAIRRLTP